MRRLVYLRAEAMDAVEEFESAVKEIEVQTSTKETDEKQDVPIDPTEKSGEPPGTRLDETPQSNSKELMRRLMKDGERGTHGSRTHDGIKLEDVLADNGDEVSSQYKKLWRAIAKKTHPDVAGDDEELTLLYKAAAAAWEKKNRGELLDVAAEVSIDLESPHRRLMSDAEGRCLHYEEMIRKVKSSIAWQWRHAEDDKKKVIVDLIAKSKAEKRLKGDG